MDTVPRVLVVDDEAVIRSLMADLLKEEGYEVECVASAPEALDLLKKPVSFDVMFTDLMMPEMDGITLIRKSRRIAPTLIPIIMTGYATLETARAAVREGAFDYITKPFSLGDIKNSLEHAVDRNRLIADSTELRDLTELFHISETINATNDRRELLDYVTQSALERVGASRASIMLVSADGRELEIGASIGIPEPFQHSRVRIEGSMSGWVVKNGLPLCVSDLHERPELAPFSLGLKDPSFLSVPLERKHQGNLVNGNAQSVHAVLNVNSKLNGGQFSERDLKVLSIVANQSSIALENVRLLEDVEQAHLSTIESMARLLEAKDLYTHGHSQRVANYALMAGRELGLSSDDLATLRMGALLHDVGKVGISDAILNKSDPLNEADWDAIHRHPMVGYEILSPAHLLNDRHLSLVRSHHERLDGSGYPDGLKGEELDLLVRILAVADTYDAMSGDRAYRNALSKEAMVRELAEASGQKLDATVTEIFIRLIKTGAIIPGSAKRVTV